jgi:hypothetical protein
LDLNLTRNSGNDYTVAQRRIYRKVEDGQERRRARSKKQKKEGWKGIMVSRNRKRIADWLRFQSRLNENFLDFFDFAVKKI